MEQLIAFTDGSSSRKKSKIGSGFVILKGDKVIQEFSIAFSNCGRNGAAELIGMILCLESLLFYKDKKITVYCDAQYVVYSINEWVYKWILTDFFLIKNIELIIYVLYLNSLFSNLDIKWIKGHQEGDSFEVKGNQLADKLAGKWKDESNFKNIYDFEEFSLDVFSIVKEKNLKNTVKDYYTYQRI